MLSRCMYSLHGFEPLIRPDSGQVCQWLMVSSYWMPGSAQAQAASAILRKRDLASTSSMTSPVIRARRPNLPPGSTAFMNSSFTRTELLAFWYWTDVMSSPPRSMSKPASRRARIFSSSFTLVSMKSSMSGWSTSRMTILAARRVAPPDLMVPAEASAPRMKETGPEALPPEESSSLEERIRERFRPAPEPPLKIMPSSLYQSRIDSMESSTARMKQARDLLRLGRADVEPHRRVEAEDLVQEGVRQLVLEDLGVGGRGEVAVVLAGLAVGLHDPVDELLEAGLALRGADSAAEVLAGDDVDRVHRPEVGELDATLLEVDRAVAPVGHDDVTALPGHLVVRMHAGGGVDALDTQPLGRPWIPWRGNLVPGRSPSLSLPPPIYGQKRPEVPDVLPVARCLSDATGTAERTPGRSGCRRAATAGPAGRPVSRRRWRARGPRGSRRPRTRRLLCGGPLLAQFRDGGLEVLERVERPVDGREAQVRDEVELLQRAEYGQPHVVGGQLGAAGGAHRLLDPLAELGEGVLGDRPPLARLAHAGDDLGAAEGFGHARCA